MFHLRRNDYSRWFRDSVRDSYLADQAERIERRMDLTPYETRVLPSSSSFVLAIPCLNEARAPSTSQRCRDRSR